MQSQFAEAIKTHTDAAQRELAVLKADDADRAAIAEIAFASALAVQSEVLEGDLAHADTDVDTEDAAILAVAHVVDEARTSVETAQAEAPVTYENLLAAVESESTQMYELFESVREDASAEEIVDIERRLSDVQRKIADARVRQTGEVPAVDQEMMSVAAALMNSEGENAALSATADALATTEGIVEDVPTEPSETPADVSLMTTMVEDTAMAKQAAPAIDPEVAKQESVVLLKGALTDIQKLINYLTNIEVRESVSIEKLVPVTPTAGERAREIKSIYDSTKSDLAEVTKTQVSSRFKNKVRYGKETIEEKLAETSRAMSVGNLDEAKKAVLEAKEYALDLKKLITTTEPVKEVVEEPEESSTAEEGEAVEGEITEEVVPVQ